VNIPKRSNSSSSVSETHDITHSEFFARQEQNGSPPLLLSSNDRITLCLVDAGMVAQLTEDEAAIYIGLLASIGEGDGEQAAKFALKFSIDNNDHLNHNERNEFIHDMVQLFHERCHGYGTNVDLGNVLRGVLVLLGKHKVRVDANFATLVVNVLCVQGLASDVCPEFNVLDSAKPLLQAYRKLCLNQDGEPIRNPRNSKYVRFRLMSMYLQKLHSDNRFFNKLMKKRRQGTYSHKL
jgi:predicted unusual protein kinase regulating ubiquinone biosynthesis (AarF/ABC1/UbiB family)